jgi:hypothetical protein
VVHDPFNRSRIPADHIDRPERVRLLLEAERALAAGVPVPPDAARLLGNALKAWLLSGGDLDRHLQLRAPQGSHRTAKAFAHQFLKVTGVAEVTRQPVERRRFDASSGRAQPDLFSEMLDP